MYLLLCGCGTGFSVQKHHIAKLPDLLPKKEGSKKYVIPDTIEGWSDAVGVLVSSYFDQFLEDELFGEYSGKTVNFDFSEIRPAGAYLKSSGGKAPGPEPLKKALTNIRKILDKALKDGQSKLLCTPLTLLLVVGFVVALPFVFSVQMTKKWQRRRQAHGL
jgi:ribonucleoside-diphosphate reductase alpha chain